MFSSFEKRGCSNCRHWSCGSSNLPLWKLMLIAPINLRVDDVLLCKPKVLRDDKRLDPIYQAALGSITMRDYGKDLRQRESAALNVTKLEAVGCNRIIYILVRQIILDKGVRHKLT
ncbi:hypothetical protein Plhal304r1_c035g0107951 [Plasmopara halstedii]